MTRKIIVMFSFKNNFQELHWWALHWRDTQTNTEVFPPTVYNSLTHYVQLEFFLPANKHPTSYEDVFTYTVSEAAELGVNVFPTIVYADFETAIHNAVKTVWPGLEVKACRFHLEHNSWLKLQSLGLSKQYGKKDSEVSQFLKKIFRLSFYHRRKSATALLWSFYPIFPTTIEWNSFATTC